MPILLKAPEGKARVVEKDSVSFEDFMVDDYDSSEEALRIADYHNAMRNRPYESIYYVYDDKGSCIGGGESLPYAS